MSHAFHLLSLSRSACGRSVLPRMWSHLVGPFLLLRVSAQVTSRYQEIDGQLVGSSAWRSPLLTAIPMELELECLFRASGSESRRATGQFGGR